MPCQKNRTQSWDSGPGPAETPSTCAGPGSEQLEGLSEVAEEQMREFLEQVARQQESSSEVMRGFLHGCFARQERQIEQLLTRHLAQGQPGLSRASSDCLPHSPASSARAGPRPVQVGWADESSEVRAHGVEAEEHGANGLQRALSVPAVLPCGFTSSPAPEESSNPPGWVSERHLTRKETEQTLHIPVGDDPTPESRKSGAGQVLCIPSDIGGRRRAAVSIHSNKSCQSSASVSVMLKSFSEAERLKKNKTKFHDFMPGTSCSFQSSDEGEPLSWRWYLKRAVASVAYEVVTAAVLITNVIYIGAQVQYRATREVERLPRVFTVLDTVYAVAFVFELALRIAAAGPVKFFRGSDQAVNVFDFFVITCSVIETLLSLLGENHVGALANLSFLRIVRMTRMLRIIRMVRVVRFFRALRVLIAAIISTSRSCIWTMLLLLMIMYMFAVALTQYTTAYLVENDREGEMTPLRFYFGTLWRSLFTLFKSVIGGMDWEVATDALGQVSWVCVALFCVYVSFVYLAVMNVVMGIFLQNAIEQAQQDEEHAIELKLKGKHQYVRNLRRVFHEFNSLGDGFLTLPEFEQHLQDDRMKAFLETVEINAADAWTFFKLLDDDDSGYVDIQKWLDGCMRLRGQAKSLHLAEVMYENRWIMDKLNQLTSSVHQLRKSTKSKLAAPSSSESLDQG